MATTTHSRRSHRRSSSNDRMNEFRRQAGHIGNSVRAMAETAGEAAGDRLGPVEDYVREKPVKALLLALAAGAVLGAIFLRR